MSVYVCMYMYCYTQKGLKCNKDYNKNEYIRFRVQNPFLKKNFIGYAQSQMNGNPK